MSIRLSKEYGLNPSMLLCPACGGDAGIALLGANNGKEAPRKMLSNELCKVCKKHIKEGKVVVIEVKEENQEYRTGLVAYVDQVELMKVLPELKVEHTVIRLSDEVCRTIGIVRERE